MRPPGGPQQPPRPQQPPGPPVAGPPRPFLPGGVVAPPPRGPVPPRPSGPNSFAPQQVRPPPPQGPQSPQGPPQQIPPGQQPPPRRQGPPPQGSIERQNSFQQRPPAPPLNPGSRQSSLASLGSAPDSPGPQVRRAPMESEATPPPGVKSRSFSIAGPPGAVPGIPQHDEERRRSVSIIGGRPEESVSRGPGLAFIKEGVQSFESKESPLNVGLTRLSKDDVTRGSRESVRSDCSDGKGVERPESRLSGSKMTESIMGSLDSDERKNGSPLARKNDDDDDVVTQNNKQQNGTPIKSAQENGHKVAALPLDRSPSLTSDSSPDPKLNLLGKTDSPNRPSSALSNASKTPEPLGKASPIPAVQGKDSTRPPSSASIKSEQRVDTPEPKNTEVRNGTPDSVNGRPGSRAGPKPTDLGTPIKSGTPDDKKSTPVRKAASAPRSRRGISY